MSTTDLLGEGLGGYGGLGGYTSTALRDPEMAAALRKQALGASMMKWKPEGPVLSPWQGVDALVKGLMGGYFVGQGDQDMKDHAAKQDAEASDFKNNMAGLLMGGQPQAPTPQSSGMGAALSGQPAGGGAAGQQLPDAQADGWNTPYYPGSNTDKQLPAIVHQLESGGQMKPGIVGDGGAAAGPMQVHQAALDDVNKAQGTNYTMADLVQKPEIGKAVGDAYTGILRQRYPGRPDLVLAAYNGGMGNVDRGTIPPAAQAYAQRGMGMMGQGTQYAGPGVPQDPQGQMPQQAPAAGPDPEAMMARAAQIRQAALQASNHSNPQIAKQAAYMGHYADSLERQAQTLQGRIERQYAYTQRQQDKQDSYTQHQADLQAARDLAVSNRPLQHVTMQDPDGKGVGIYEMTPQGPGRRLGAAPKQPGESSGPFGGNAMEAQANNILLGIGPKIANGTATDQEKGQYSLAYQHLQNGNVQMVPDPTDPSGNRQVLARIPGNIPPQFPPPPGAQQAGPAQPGAPAPQQAQPGAPAPQQAAPGAPQVVPGTTKFAPIPEKIMEGMINNNQAITKIDKALTSLDAHQGSVGPMNSIVPGSVRQYTDPSGVATRALVADIGSLKLHDRSGAAVTAAEEPRLRPFIPSVSDAPATVREKLNNFRQEYTKILSDTYSSYGPKSGGRPLPEIEKTLSGGQQQMAAGQPSPDAVQAELRRRGLLK